MKVSPGRATSQSQRTGPEDADRAVREERARIARELHDVVAFHISLIAVQAETACYRAPDLPASAVSELRSVSAQAQEALAEMRRLLGTLRGAGPAEQAAQRGLGDVADMIAGRRHARAAVYNHLVEEPARHIGDAELPSYRPGSVQLFT